MRGVGARFVARVEFSERDAAQSERDECDQPSSDLKRDSGGFHVPNVAPHLPGKAPVLGSFVPYERTGIRRAIPLIAVAAALLLAAPTQATRPNTHHRPDPCHGQSVSAKQFQEFAESVWLLKRWERGDPKAKTIAAAHEQLACAAGPGHRKAMKHRWGESRREYYEHRDRKLAQRERLRYLPFACGGGTRSAIDCSVMWCESGGSYSARNPTSSAGGKYQILDSTWAAYGGKSYSDSHPAAVAPPAEQDRVAAAIWADVGSSAWACA
jgi:transglycosylase-like protein